MKWWYKGIENKQNVLNNSEKFQSLKSREYFQYGKYIIYRKKVLECPHFLVSFLLKCNIRSETGPNPKRKLDEFSQSEQYQIQKKKAFWFFNSFLYLGQNHWILQNLMYKIY